MWMQFSVVLDHSLMRLGFRLACGKDDLHKRYAVENWVYAGSEF
jgi:hypothetical protein